MATSYDSFQKRRLRTSYISVVISITLVLFMVGVLGLVLLQSSKVANSFREEIVMQLFLNDETTVDELGSFKEDLLREEYTKNIDYITKEEAKELLGEDFVEFIGYNPLKNLIEVHLKADFVTPEKMDELEKKFRQEAFIYDVDYDKVLVEKLEENIQQISFWLIILSSFFGIVAIMLINSSIRLSIYAKRFNIKTMQMVGATKSFIRKPFISQSIRLGIVGAIFALIGLGFVIYYIDYYIPELGLLEDYLTLGYIAGGVLFTGFFITWISTFFAAQRFLNLQTNELYD